jgi:hypothetical protein
LVRDRVITVHPDAEITVRDFDSGGFSVDVRLRGRMFTLMHSPRHGFGVSELYQDNLEFTGFDDVFETEDAAVVQLLSLLEAAD